MNVVAHGTGQRLRGTFLSDDVAPLPTGGKTGTGDNRFKTFGSGHGIIESRVVDRTATFVFFLGSLFYGTVTVCVAGPAADHYHFGSALAVQLLKPLAPELRPLIARQHAPVALAPSPAVPPSRQRISDFD
jgi:hypothetical protein